MYTVGSNVSDVHMQEEYRLLSLQTTPRPRTEAEYNHTHASATLPFNKAKNRYTDVLPVEATRIKLAAREDDPGSDYINANQVTDPTPAAHDGSTNDHYICSQAPLQNTLNDFWRMVWEQVRSEAQFFRFILRYGVTRRAFFKSCYLVCLCVTLPNRKILTSFVVFLSRSHLFSSIYASAFSLNCFLLQDVSLIVVLMRLIENGKVKGHRYWPSRAKRTMHFNDISVTLVKGKHFPHRSEGPDDTDADQVRNSFFLLPSPFAPN